MSTTNSEHNCCKAEKSKAGDKLHASSDVSKQSLSWSGQANFLMYQKKSPIYMYVCTSMTVIWQCNLTVYTCI